VNRSNYLNWLSLECLRAAEMLQFTPRIVNCKLPVTNPVVDLSTRGSPQTTSDTQRSPTSAGPRPPEPLR
jgi:hypothetical protein